jgi:hypothetical protein
MFIAYMLFLLADTAVYIAVTWWLVNLLSIIDSKLIVGVISGLLDLSGVFVGVGFNDPFSKAFDLLSEAAVATTLIVVDVILIFWGYRKR